MKLSFLSKCPVVLCALSVALGGMAHAQMARSVYLYNSSFGGGTEGVVPDARPGSWGNGGARPSRRVDYEGAPSLQISTRSFVEGARFDLTRPVDPTPYLANGFVRLRLKFRDSSGGGTGGGRGNFPGGGRGGFPGGGRGGFGGGNPPATPGFQPQFEMVPHWQGAAQFGPPGGGALPGFGGGPGGPGFGGGLPGGGATGLSAPSQSTFIKELKVQFLREQGALSGRIRVNLNSLDNQPENNGWRLFTLAVKDMTSTPGASGPIRRVVLTSDAPDTFYMAQMALVVETGRITVSIRTPDKPAGTQMAELEWKPERPLVLVADVEAGAADPQVEWNFDADNVGNLPAPAVSGGPVAGGAVGPDGAVNPAPGGFPPGVFPTAPQRNPRAQLGVGPTQRMPRTNPLLGGNNGTLPGAGAAVPLGPRIDARGLVASFSYPNEEQNYRIEVTVRDRSGQKPPVTASLLVRVRG